MSNPEGGIVVDFYYGGDGLDASITFPFSFCAQELDVQTFLYVLKQHTSGSGVVTLPPLDYTDRVQLGWVFDGLPPKVFRVFGTRIFDVSYEAMRVEALPDTSQEVKKYLSRRSELVSNIVKSRLAGNQSEVSIALGTFGNLLRHAIQNSQDKREAPDV